MNKCEVSILYKVEVKIGIKGLALVEYPPKIDRLVVCRDAEYG